MPAWIQRIETSLPGFSFSQEEAMLKMQEWARDDRERRLVRAVYRNSGIDRRHSVLRTFDGQGEDAFFLRAQDGTFKGPGTAARNDVFAAESRAISVALARKIIGNCPGIGPGDVTHVVTVSCTGFYNPGPDYYIVRELGLSDATQRYHLGFMGCYAAFPALRMACQFCEADPCAVVLVMCVELCSIHLQLTGTEDCLLANSLFADGAGAAIVSAREPTPGNSSCRIEGFRSALVPGGEQDMTWRIGDHGFDIVLSSYVPKLIGANIQAMVLPALAAVGLSPEDIDTWAVHPGGKAIIDQVQKSLGLSPERVRASREVLRTCGNMSSASILFVLEEILRNPSGTVPERICAIAFGPGLTVELATLAAVPASAGAGVAPVPAVGRL
ncbi:MAG: putative naringenin-chalcone synthase [Deltaproteobacteria bacterium]|nr:putative naringenin-chalcone synthase [Deltaproteobacteria bacterium]